MRRSGPCPRQWIFIACLLVGAASVGATELPLREAAWLGPESNPVAALSTAPAECFRPPRDRTRAVVAEAGRIVFRSPLLLGGPAAKAGLSCHSCHINGHANPDFFIEGLSRAPGTVDVTSSRFSRTRGDGIFNPKIIPSLVDQARARKTRPADHDKTFVHGVIVDEFQGWEPASAVFDALLAYVSALDPGACPETRVVALTLGDDLTLIRRGAAALAGALDRGDLALADFLLVSLRSLLGQVHERFGLPGLEPARAMLIELSRDLGDLREPAPTVAALAVWREQLDQITTRLLPLQARSLYNPEVLRAAVAAAAAP
ncbi:MAG: hypothetical protein ACT4QA_05865 [Panacagrimonas sp.]